MMKEPIILPGAASKWPAANWTFESLCGSVGEAAVTVHSGRWKLNRWRIRREGVSKMTPVRDYLRCLISGNPSGYLAGHELFRKVPALKADLDFPNVGIFSVDVVWIGPSGSFTPIHFDLAPNYYVQLQGSKHWKLWRPNAKLKPLFSGFGGFAMSKLGLGENSKIMPMPDLDITLNPGDVLILPPHWWHSVETLTDSIAVNRWWRFEKLGRFLDSYISRLRG